MTLADAPDTIESGEAPPDARPDRRRRTAREPGGLRRRGDRGLGSATRNAVPLVSSSLALFASTVVASLLFASPTPAEAATFRVRTYSLGRATQSPRADGTAHSRRIFTQGLDLRGFNLLEDGPGRLDAVVEGRYSTDFEIPNDRRDDALYADQWNDLALRLAYLDWRPTPEVGLRFGRQWSRGTLGIRDFDGLRLELRPTLDSATDGLLVVFGGRSVQLGSAAFNTDDFDVQGLPATNDGDADPASPRPGSEPWVAGGRTGLRWADGANVTFSYRKRWRSGPGRFAVGGDTRTGSERFGVATTIVPHDRVTVSASAVYNALLRDVDRASLDVAWNLPDPFGTLSTGLEHRRPWFDASSIFNLFGTRPHQGARLVYQHSVPQLQTEFQFRHWGRIYRGDERSTGFRRTRRKTTRLGAAVAHFSDLFPFGHSVDWTSQVSLESDTRGRESAHLLADTRASTPFVFDGVYVTGRALFLGTVGERPGARSGVAGTYVLGLDIPVQDLGTFGIRGERTTGSFRRSTTNLFATLRVEVWR